MSLSQNFATVKPSLNLDFANTKRLDPRITFTRASTAVYYNGVTTAKAEENLLTYSQDLDNAAWANTGTTETANTSTAPDGTTTADTLNDGASTSGHDTGQNFSGTSGVTYTLSAFFKDVDRQFVILACSAGTATWAGAKFDLTAGTAGSTSAAGAGWSTTSSSITSVGNGWYRCTITFVSGSTATLTGRLGMATDSTTFTAGQRGLESYTGSNKTIYIWGAQIEQRSAVTAYTPTTTQAITNYIPVLQTAASGEARFDHNPITGESLGLLIEEARTNLLTYSDQFSDASWTKQRSTVNANTVIAPDGTLNADKLIEDTTASSSHYTNSGYVASASLPTASLYAKAAERSYISLQIIRDNGVGFSSAADLVVSLVDGSFTGGAGSSPTVTNVGNGWWRISLTATTTATTNYGLRILLSSGPVYSNTSYTGNGYSGFYVWGAQLEAGSFATSYIPTVASQVTRAADAASMTGTNFSSWYRADEGSFYAEAVCPSLTDVTLFAANDATQNNQIDMRFAITTTAGRVRIGGANAPSLAAINSAPTVGANYKTAIAYKASDSAATGNGGSVASSSAYSTLPSINQFEIGRRAAASYLNSTITKLAYYPKRLTNTQLQALTL